MKKLFLLSMLFAATVCNAQVVLWDGEDASITSRNEYGGFWDRGNPSVVDNPEKDGINPSDKCLKFTMTGDAFGQKHVACPFRDWIQPNLAGNRRLSFMIKKSVNENVLVELSDPTNPGAEGYWQKVAAWYGGSGKWQKVVLDFTGVNVVSNSFADECIAKLLLEMPLSELKRRTTFRGLNPLAERSVLVALQRRYKVINS